MLELRNVKLSTDKREIVSNLSLVVERGKMVTINGHRFSDMVHLLKAILGMMPIDAGYITLDGEPVTLSSAPFLRTMMSLIPYPRDYDTKLTPAELQMQFLREVSELDHDVVLAEYPALLQDEAGQQKVAQTLRKLADKGRMVLVISENPYIQQVSNEIIEL